MSGLPAERKPFQKDDWRGASRCGPDCETEVTGVEELHRQGGRKDRWLGS